MPRPLPLMSGNFDNPPASEPVSETANRIVREILDNTQGSDADISPSGELYRAIEQFHQRRSDLQATIDGVTADQMASEREQELRQLLNDAAEGGSASPLFTLRQPTSPPPSDSPFRGGRIYRRGTMRGSRGPSVRTQRRRSYLANAESAASNGLADLQHAGRQLEAASSNLRALLDDPVPHLASPVADTQSQEYSEEAAHNRRVKRRKLDTDRLDSEFAGFSYGRYGQVEPGQLKMEIVSCDGGIYQESGGNYEAENVLKDNSDVYCTKSNRCNLVLRHQGATAFCLKELVIKAPHAGYTAPVQEGMVFVSMTSDDLLARTAQYQIQYSSSKNVRPGSPSRNDTLPPILSIRHSSDGTMSTAQVRARRLYHIGLQDEDCDYRTAQIPSEFTSNAPPFVVTTECSDSENDEPRVRQRTLHRIIDRISDSSDSSDDEMPGLTSARAAGSSWADDYLTSHRPRWRGRASDITLAEAADASQVATQEAVKAVGGELMAPHARFFIERDKSKCTVRFDPPVSGRFILLKMWSPQQSPSGNIDIQSVVAKGFAGPRFFPAVSLR